MVRNNIIYVCEHEKFRQLRMAMDEERAKERKVERRKKIAARIVTFVLFGTCTIVGHYLGSVLMIFAGVFGMLAPYARKIEEFLLVPEEFDKEYLEDLEEI